MSPPPFRSRSAASIGTSSHWRILTQIAFILAVAVVIARMTSVEILRDPWDAVPGNTPTLRGPGPTTSLLLDLVATLPALLTLARRVFDPSFRLTRRWSYLPMLLLGLWTIASIFWSTDQFAATIAAAQLASGLCLLWAVSQLEARWLNLRLIAAVCFGLLLLLFAKTVLYRVIDVPANHAYWIENRTQFLQQRGWKPGSFHALQFEQKILSGETVGFFSSANTLGAIAVFLLAISIGIGIQKIKDNRSRAWLVIPLTAAAAAIWIIVESRSKAAGATPLLGVFLFIAVLSLRSQFRRHATSFYWTGVLIVFTGLFAAVAFGLHENGLFPGHFSNSLDFRWKYWVASVHLFLGHPVVGIGWNNFGFYYLAHRLPEASEEIKDPHNLLVRFFVELGAVGGVLLILWLLRLAWELTRPGVEGDTPVAGSRPPAGIGSVLLLPIAGMVLSILVNVDFTQIGDAIFLELVRDFLFLLMLSLGTLAAAMLSPHKKEVDSRPSPWLFYSALIAMGLLLIHNLIDFSFFEPGPMFLFFLVTGAALNVAPGKEPRSSKTSRAAIALVAGSVGWFAALAFVGQVAVAEQSAYDATEDIRTAPPHDPSLARAHFARAAAELRSALDHIPFNADYALQAAKAGYSAGELPLTQDSIAAAIRINPRLIDAYLLQANLELRLPNPDAGRIQFDFEKILELNPNDVSLHTQFGQALERLGLFPAAQRQYELALKYNAALPADEPKRLSPEELSALQLRIGRRN